MSTVVGAVFAVIVMSSAVTYTGVSMNQITELAQEIETKQIVDVEKTSEAYEIVGLRTDNDQFNMTVINTGDLPIHLTRLWVENTTDSSFPILKYNLDITIPTGGDIDDIGQGLGLSVVDTESYMLMLVTERGNTQKMFVNGLGDADSSVYLNLRATPSLVPAGFSSSIILEVINTGTNKLLNLVPELDSVVESCTTTCSATLVSGPTPTNATSLDPGNIAIFEWVYTLSGEDSGADNAVFTASLVNGLEEVTSTLALQPVQEAENADVALESGGVVGDPLISDGILIWHMEQDNVPSPGYQMMSSSVEGGVNGLLVNMETKTAANPISFFTNNGSLAITVPAGKWNASLALRSEPVPTGLKDQNEDMIFHFEDGDGVPPDNSEGDGNRDLTNCGLTTFQERISISANDAEQDAGGSNDTWGGSSDHELVYDGNMQYIGLRWSLDVPKDATIASADIRFRSDESQTGSSPSLIIGAQDIDNAAEFANISDNIEDRWDGTVSSVTSATVTWSSINGWSSGEEGTDTTTPDLSSIIQEIVNRPGWVSGQNIVIMFKDNSGGSNTGKRTAEHYDGGGAGQAARLTVSYGTTGTPDWQDGSGPHGSGAYYYDGANMCHRSTENVSDARGNDIQNNPTTTSLWFRTDGVDQVSTEQMLVFWEGGGNYPSSDYYKISLGEDGTGRILFEFNMDLGGGDTSTCRSVNEYDDGNWYNVIAVKTFSNDRCDLYITDITGVDAETPLTHSPNHGSSSVDVDGRWYVGSMEQRAYYFNGWIDDIMHWNDDALTADEAEDLSITNYGGTAHQLDVSMNVTDSNGVVTSNVYLEKGISIPFVDSKGLSDSTDSAYTMTNVTMILPQVSISALERLNYTMSFVPSTSTWEALELDMKIDDVGFVTPYPSYLQLPEPDNPFPSYVVYDNDDEMELFVNNTGEDGIYFVFPGTRLSFYSETLGSYASLVHYVNGTSAPYAVDVDKDSIYIPTGESAQIFFFAHPSNHPCAGSNCQNADFIPPGVYSMAAWVNGYSDQGETFGRTVQLGTVTVQE